MELEYFGSFVAGHPQDVNFGESWNPQRSSLTAALPPNVVKTCKKKKVFTSSHNGHLPKPIVDGCRHSYTSTQWQRNQTGRHSLLAPQPNGHLLDRPRSSEKRHQRHKAACPFVSGLAIQSGQGPLGCKSKLLFGIWDLHQTKFGVRPLGSEPHTNPTTPAPGVAEERGRENGRFSRGK